MVPPVVTRELASKLLLRPSCVSAHANFGQLAVNTFLTVCHSLLTRLKAGIDRTRDDIRIGKHSFNQPFRFITLQGHKGREGGREGGREAGRRERQTHTDGQAICYVTSVGTR